MSGGHGHAHGLYRPGASPVHRMRPQCKLAATGGFVLAVVATPREAFWVFGLDALLVVVTALLAGLPLRSLARRLVVETPFLAFALFLPLVGEGRRVDVLGLSLSVAGLWAAWNILVKGTLGVAATVLLASTTTVPELLHGLDRMRVPRAFTAVAGFMVRYAEVVTGEMRRMRVARQSRGHDLAPPRRRFAALAATAGTLFVRSYERGERVHLAMLSRGFTGGLPAMPRHQASRRQWHMAAVMPTIAVVAAALAAGGLR